MIQEDFSRQKTTQALISNDKRAWEAHKKRREREKAFDQLQKKVECLEEAVAKLNQYIEERVQ
jgi:peptidoglycan hydrolase CwlO-like protein